MAQVILKYRNEAGYTVERKPTDEPGKFLVTGGSKPYVVTLIPGRKGARCSCPAAIFSKARKSCKHEAMVVRALEVTKQMQNLNPQISLSL